MDMRKTPVVTTGCDEGGAAGRPRGEGERSCGDPYVRGMSVRPSWVVGKAMASWGGASDTASSLQ